LEAFIVPWAYTLNNDPFESPRSAPDFTSLSWEPFLTPDGSIVECDHPESTIFNKTSFKNFEEKSIETWDLRERVCSPHLASLSAFNPLIDHFLLRAHWQEGIDELISYMTTIDAAIGKQQKGMTKAIGKRLKRLLNDEGASQEFERLYDLRSAYIHGRGEDRSIPTSDLIAARRLARRTAEAVLSYAGMNPGTPRDRMLDELDGAMP
jgi:hypothetical protein